MFDILQDIYYESPTLRNELLNRDNISAQGQSARTSLIKMMASQRHDPELGYDSDKFPPDKTLFNAVFKPDLASSKEALIPEPPPPMIRASNSKVLIFVEL